MTLRQYLDQKKSESFSWQEIEDGVEHVLREIRKRNIHPNLIVGIARSGGIMGGMIAGNLGTLPILIIDRQYDWSKGTRKTRISGLTKSQVSGKVVLLVDGRSRTGETLKIARDYLEHFDTKKVFTAALTYSKQATFIADIVAYPGVSDTKVQKVPWILTKDWKEDSRASQEKS